MPPRPGPEVPEMPVDITATTFGVPPPIDNTPPASPIMTTAQVNGNPDTGSIDNGGQLDAMCAWWVNQDSPYRGEMVQLQDLNQQYSNRFGLPLYVPSILGMGSQLWSFALGALYGGYHGYRRSGGKALPTLGYGVLTAYLPLIGIGASLFQGPFKRKGR